MSRLTIGLGAIAAAFLLLLAPAAAVADGDPTDGTGITVNVGDGSTPTPSPTGGSGGGGHGGHGGGTPTPTPSATATPPPGTTLPGVPVLVAVSGLTASISPMPWLPGGDVTLTLTVRNSTKATLDTSTRFWVTNVFGMTVAQSADVRTIGLAPGETRRIRATLRDVGQYTFYVGHATLTPTSRDASLNLVPVTRDAVVFMPPILAAILVLCIGGLGVAIWWFLIRLRPWQPVPGAGA